MNSVGKQHTMWSVIWVGVLIAGLTPMAPASINKGGAPASDSAGSVKGVVKFDGKQKKRKPIRMSADASCAAAHPDAPPMAETYVFGDNDTLQNVLVYIDAKLKADAPAKALVIDQVGCMYSPHVSAAMVGQEVQIKNSDNTMHNVNFKPTSGSKNAAFNVSQPGKGMVEKKKFNDQEKGAKLSCQVHPWMGAYLWVFEHPYFAVTQQDGSFEITGLPPGEYEVKTWHELKAFKPSQVSYKVKVEAGKVAEVEVVYRPPGKK